MLVLLVAVTVAGVPQRVVHAHSADHESALVVPTDGQELTAYDVASDDPSDPPLGETQLHAHCLGAFSTLLPSVLIGIPCRPPQVDRAPSGLASPVCEGHPTTPYRPPIV